MAFKEISPKLQLNFDEYVETWRCLLIEYYSQGLSSVIVDDLLKLDDQKLATYGLELATIVLIIGMKAWSGCKGMQEEAKQKVRNTVVTSYYESIFDKDKPDFQKECILFYNTKNKIFSELCRNLGANDEKVRQMDIVGLARYLAAQVSDSPESHNKKAIEQIGILLISAGNACMRLAKNTSQSLQMMGSPKFVIQK